MLPEKTQGVLLKFETHFNPLIVDGHLKGHKIIMALTANQISHEKTHVLVFINSV